MSKFMVSKEIEFDAGHRVPLHESKCRNPHGHRYRIIANVVGELQSEGSATGMVLDFGDIKKELQKIHDVFDHGFIVQDSDVELKAVLLGHGWKVITVKYPPTAEELARAIYNIILVVLPGLKSIEVYETPTSSAMYPWSIW